MTSPLFLVPEAALADVGPGALVTVDGAEGRHAVSVRRLSPGEPVDIGDGRGLVVRGLVEALPARDRLDVRIVGATRTPAPQPRLVVVQALPKGERGQVAVATLTEVGVDEIVPWAAQRCVARWVGDRAEAGRQRWLGTAREAGKQAHRPWLPEVARLSTTGDLVRRVAQAAAAVVLHEEAAVAFAGLRWPTSGEVVLVVGPEGGVSPQELAEFTDAGATAARMGPSVLRTSTAGTVAAAVVLAGTSRWR